MPTCVPIFLLFKSLLCGNGFYISQNRFRAMTGAISRPETLNRKQHPPRATLCVSRLLLVVKHSIAISHNQGQCFLGISTNNCVFCNMRENFWKTAYITKVWMIQGLKSCYIYAGPQELRRGMLFCSAPVY